VIDWGDMKPFRRGGASECLNRKLMVIYCQECAGRFLVLSECYKERKPVNVEKPYCDKTTREQELKRRNLPPFLNISHPGRMAHNLPNFRGRIRAKLFFTGPVADEARIDMISRLLGSAPTVSQGCIHRPYDILHKYLPPATK
jgi:hypothetical protein